MSKSSQGMYYVRKTKKWLEWKFELCDVVQTEKAHQIFLKDSNRILYSKKDIWGADLMWRTLDRFGFIQVKKNRGDVSKGKKQLSFGPWPPFVERWVCCWEPRAKIQHGPEIFVVTTKWARNDDDEEKYDSVDGEREGAGEAGQTNLPLPGFGREIPELPG